MINRILLVCSGNICRSPLAKALFDHALPEIEFDSAGVLVERSHLTGREAVEHSQALAKINGLDLSGHKAKQVNKALVERSDLILVMNHEHIELLSEITDGARAKTLLLGQWIGVGEIEDPIGKDLAEFEKCYRLLARAVESWKSRLSP